MYNPIITITLKPTVGATAAIDVDETGKDHGTATVALSFEGNTPEHMGGFVDTGGGGFAGAMWDTLPPQRHCGEVAELSAETALALSTLLNKGFAMNAELNVVKPEATACCDDDGLFTPPFPRSPEDHQNEDMQLDDASGHLEPINASAAFEADVRAVADKLDKAMKLIEMLTFPERVACKVCHGHSAVYGGADCPACHSCGYVTRTLQTATTVATAANPGPIKKARKRK